MQKDYTSKEIIDFLEKTYDLSKIQNVKRFTSGVIDTSYHVITDTEEFVFKIYTSNPDLLIVKSQVEFMQYCFDKELPVQQPLLTKMKHVITEFDTFPSTLLSYLEGEMLANVELNQEIISSVAQVMATAHQKVSDFMWDHENKDHVADLLYLCRSEAYIEDIHDIDVQKRIREIISVYKTILPKLQQCKMGMIHHDYTHQNTLVHNSKVSGVVDFGNATKTILLGDIIVTTSAFYFIDGIDPVLYSKVFFQEYAKLRPLDDIEKEVFVPLLFARFSNLVLWATKQRMNGCWNDAAKYYWNNSTQIIAYLDTLSDDAFNYIYE